MGAYDDYEASYFRRSEKVERQAVRFQKHYWIEKVGQQQWTTKDGQTLRFRDMTDGHLLNVANFVVRRFREKLDCLCGMQSYLQGEMAIAAVEAEIDGLACREGGAESAAETIRQYVKMRREIQ